MRTMRTMQTMQTLPIEVVCKVFTYMSSPTAHLIQQSKFFRDICPSRHLRGGLEGASIDENPNQMFIEHDFHTFYSSYVTYDDLFRTFWYQCKKGAKPVDFDKESCYAFLYEHMYKANGRASLSLPNLIRSNEFREVVRNRTWMIEQMDRFVERYGKK